MTDPFERRPGIVALLAGVALLSIAACSGMGVPAVPTAQSVAGLTPSGTVRVTETFVAGVGGGSGTLQFEGRSHPFRLIGGVTGGMGLEKNPGHRRGLPARQDRRLSRHLYAGHRGRRPRHLEEG